MELRTIIVSDKESIRGNSHKIIVELVVEEESGEEFIFKYIKPLKVDLLLPAMENLPESPIPKPLKHNGYSIFNEVHEPLKQKDEITLKEEGCSIAEFKVSKNFILKVEMKGALSHAKFFAGLISKQLKYQLDRHMKNIYCTTLTIEKPADLNSKE